MTSQSEFVETICAIATPAGRGGVSIIRISGPQAFSLGQLLSRVVPQPNHAQFCSFRDSEGELIDQGLILYFRHPSSFTGEDVVECHIHGSPVVADEILQVLCGAGARLARPGEFSERAFLNDKIDLAQAEAVSDLINSMSSTAARHAVRSLRGDFSRRIDTLVEALVYLRMYVEAAIDFPEEEVDFLNDERICARFANIRMQIKDLLAKAKHGAVLNEGIRVVIIGDPNAGKSSLLNVLAGYDRAIVTDIAGTTRDLLDMVVTIRGVPVHLTDTAGLRDSQDPIEQEGIKRARDAMQVADAIVLLIDSSLYETPEFHPIWIELASSSLGAKTIIVMNKIDLLNQDPGAFAFHGQPMLRISVRQGAGLDLIETALLNQADFMPQEEGGFLARRRHVDALIRAEQAIDAANLQLHGKRAGELLAEDLRTAQDALGEITGKLSSDDLLGVIFSSFCIGK